MIISPKGEVIAQAGENEEVIIADIILDEVNEWREKFSALKDMRTEYYAKPFEEISK